MSACNATQWTVAVEPARLLCPWDSPRREYWSGLPGPPPGDLPYPGIKPMSLMSPALAGGFFTTKATLEAEIYYKALTVTAVLSDS